MPTIKEVTDFLGVVLPFLAAMTPIILKALKERGERRGERRPGGQRSPSRSWLRTLGLSVASGLIVYLLIAIISWVIVPKSAKGEKSEKANSAARSSATPEIQISRPTPGRHIACEGEDDQGNCSYRVTGSLSAPLAAGEKLYVAVKESGGDDWWLTGGAVEVLDDLTWSQPNASFGNKNSRVNEYILGVFITRKDIPPNSHFASLPSNVASKRTVIRE